MPSFPSPPPTRPFVGVLTLAVTLALAFHLHNRQELPRTPIARAAALESMTAPGESAAPIPGPAPSAATPAVEKPPAPAPAAPAPPPPNPGALPTGKGMWLWLPERAEGGNSQAIVDRAVASGLSHLYVRMGSSWDGPNGLWFVDDILPKAHAAGLKVFGWDFPNLVDTNADIVRSVHEARYVTPDGHRIDGFVPDIETQSEGTRLTGDMVVYYLDSLRANVGPMFPIIGCVPRPSGRLMQGAFPYNLVAERVNALAPMIYWLNRQPDSDVGQAMDWLKQFGKPIIPVGQAYDGSPEGGRPGPPPAEEINRFMQAANGKGAIGASFWSWQHASAEVWTAISSAPEFTLAASPPAVGPDVLERVQHALLGKGYQLRATARWDPATREAVRVFQGLNGVPNTGDLTADTIKALGVDVEG